MADEQRPLAPYVHFTVTDAEVDDTWQRLDGSLRPERSPRKWLVLAGAAAAALVIGFVLISSGLIRKPSEGLMLEAGTAIATGTAPLTGTLREGSMVQAEVASSGAVEVVSASQVRVRIDRGAMRFDVAKNPSRRFSVVAGDVEVRVVGTRFVVRREATASVQVERGVVEVWKGGEQRAVLTAGQTWEEPRQAVAPVIEPETDSEVEAEELAHEPATPSMPVKKKATKHKRALVAKEEPIADPVPSTVNPEPDPSALFKAALDARRAGQAPEAANAFRTFLSSFPNDSRAGLAHFELGRLQMDQLGAPSSAIDSLEHSIARSPNGSHVEDAMARLVRLHDQLRHAKACGTSKAAYLGRFPSGVHAATLERLCDF